MVKHIRYIFEIKLSLNEKTII